MPFTAPRWERAMGSSSYRGIQTIRNWPGCPPRSARKRYVIVDGVSRTTSRSGTTWILGMGDPDRLRDGAEPGVLQEGRHFFRDLVEDLEALRNDRRADLHGARARHDVLERIPAGPDAADANHGDVDLLADVVHRTYAKRTNRGTAQSAEAIRERGHLQLRRDRHRLQRVDRHNPIGSALLCCDRERRDVLDVRGELREHRQGHHVLDRPRELADRVLVLRDLAPE